MNESSFERCPHDKENPYVMISREMAQDKSISPKAKGVLLYLLSLPRDWKIYHSQLQDCLGVGEDYINSAMQELIDNGYAERTREKIKGIYQPYKYKIREFKKCLPNGKNPSGDLREEMTSHNVLNQTGFTGPVNPGLQSKEETKETLNVCYPSDDLKKNICVCKKKTPRGDDINISLEEIFRLACRKKKDWTTAEIEEAWRRFVNAKGAVSDYFKMIEGIIGNMRNSQRSENINNSTKSKTKEQDFEQRNVITITKEERARRAEYSKKLYNELFSEVKIH